MTDSILISGINGPVVTVKSTDILKMQELVFVGEEHLIGEVIGINRDYTIIQVYEITTGLRPGEPVVSTGKPLMAKLGPGILSNIFDGIERPLKTLENLSGAFISRGLNVSPIDIERKWDVTVTVKKGDTLKSGDVFATCPETSLILHKAMVPPEMSGEVISCVGNGQYTIEDPIVTIKTENGQTEELKLSQEWPVRKARPFRERLPISIPLITGQRVIDTLFPIAKGGAAAIPGGFGTGKTMTQHQLAKWCDADIIVYVGCGERGNEMTQVLEEFTELIDPKSQKPLTDRTVLIANTSNMPVAARDASIYTGITLAEYYRDMGYHVAIMADSTSRWAEALREISGRLEEMPAEEGFPAYLPSRLAAFYERSGYVHNLNDTSGSVSIIGAVSPQGGDLSEPVTQNTKRFIRCFWALDRQLAYARHYPAINWLSSYSEYAEELSPWYTSNVDPQFYKNRAQIISILQTESKLMEIVNLIGSDVLPDDQKLLLEVSRAIRLGFLQQNAYNDNDTYVPIAKQYKMTEIVLYLYERTKELLPMNIPVSVIKETGLFEKIIRIKYDIPNDKPELFDAYKTDIDQTVEKIKTRYKDVEKRSNAQ